MLTGFRMGPCQESTRMSRQVVTTWHVKQCDGCWAVYPFSNDRFSVVIARLIVEVFSLRMIIQRSEVTAAQALIRWVAAEMGVRASYSDTIMMKRQYLEKLLVHPFGFFSFWCSTTTDFNVSYWEFM